MATGLRRALREAPFSASAACRGEANHQIRSHGSVFSMFQHLQLRRVSQAGSWLAALLLALPVHVTPCQCSERGQDQAAQDKYARRCCAPTPERTTPAKRGCCGRAERQKPTARACCAAAHSCCAATRLAGRDGNPDRPASAHACGCVCGDACLCSVDARPSPPAVPASSDLRPSIERFCGEALVASASPHVVVIPDSPIRRPFDAPARIAACDLCIHLCHLTI